MSQEPPLIFSHFNFQPYLAYSLSMARKTNTNRRLILLGDAENRHVAEKFGWEHYSYKDYTSDLHRKFASVYTPVYGPKRRPYYESHAEEKNWYLFWLKYVQERWYFIAQFVKQENIEKFWHFDSDTMVLKDLSMFDGMFNEFDFTVQCNDRCLNGAIHSQVVNEFCEHMCSLYENKSFLAEKQAELNALNTEEAFTEMDAFSHFRSVTPYTGVWLMKYGDGIVFDDCLCQPHGFDTVPLPYDRVVKNVFFEDGIAYASRDGKKTELATLNLSWLSIDAYRWVYAAHASREYTSISQSEGIKMFVGIDFKSENHPSKLKNNAYLDVKRNALAGLRHKFHTRTKRLVTFASGYPFVKQQNRLSMSALRNGVADVLDNWSFDRVIHTKFYQENRDLLRQSRGQGFWLWKPFIIKFAVDGANDGDLIIYTDCSMGVSDFEECSILPVMEWLSAADNRIAISHNPWPNSQWTKRDCFCYMDSDSSCYWSHNQVAATYFAFFVNDFTRKLISDWLKYCQDPRIISDAPNTCGLENFPDFMDHRHDQSVLTNLLIKNRAILPVVRFGSEVKSKNIAEMLSFFENEYLKSNLTPSTDCISVGKFWSASSNSVWSPAEGIMHDSNEGDFFFHTGEQDDPWWQIDLNDIHYVQRIVILNRPNLPFGMRARRMKVLAGTRKEEMNLIFDASTGEWDPYLPLVLSLEREPIRFIKIELDTFETLHLQDVKVYGTLK